MRPIILDTNTEPNKPTKTAAWLTLAVAEVVVVSLRDELVHGLHVHLLVHEHDALVVGAALLHDLKQLRARQLGIRRIEIINIHKRYSYIINSSGQGRR